MALKHLLLVVILAILGLVAAIPSPHIGMVDTAQLRDVGVIYTEPNFRGKPRFIYEVKDSPQCLTLGENVLSVKICKTTASCTFYTGSDCISNRNNYAVRVGCGDAAEVNSPKGHHFNWYSCGAVNKNIYADYTIDTVPHDASIDVGFGMGA